MKVSCTVLRGLGAGNSPRLPDPGYDEFESGNMDEKLSHCYRCEPYTKSFIVDGNEKLVKAIRDFGNAVDANEDLIPETKNEIVGILNTLVGSYPSTIRVASIFDTFSKIVKGHISGIATIEVLWAIVENDVKSDKA